MRRGGRAVAGRLRSDKILGVGAGLCACPAVRTVEPWMWDLICPTFRLAQWMFRGRAYAGGSFAFL